MIINKQYATIGILIAVGMAGIFSLAQVGHNTVQGDTQSGPTPVTVASTPDQPVPV